MDAARLPGVLAVRAVPAPPLLVVVLVTRAVLAAALTVLTAVLMHVRVAVVPGQLVPLPVLVLVAGLLLSFAAAAAVVVLVVRSSPAWRPA